ncbi:MAG: NAD-dependent epimerase/dehydratase family protein [Bacteroidales bacterium]
MNKDKKIIVFGATGNIGAYVALKLNELGYSVFATGKRASDNGFFEEHGIPYYSVDIEDPESFNVLPEEDIYGVVHMAGELPSRYAYDPSALIRSITIGTLNVLEYLRKKNGQKIIFPQTPFDLYYLHNTDKMIPADGVRSFPPTGDHSVYTIAKNAAVDLIEHYYHQFGIKRFILRFFTIYQYHPNAYHYADMAKKKMPYRILMDKAIQSDPIEIWGDPARAKEIVYIKDFVRLVGKCMESPLDGGIYNVGGEKGVTLEEQIQGIVEVFSPESNPSVISYDPSRPDALKAKFDISKTQTELGYTPVYSYKEAMLDFKKEMIAEPFEKLWKRKEDYE